MKYYVVDVFAQEKYAGNQLAVFTEAGLFSNTLMQQITKEINYSETTFITSLDLKEGGYNVRIFTPAQELPFAGHPTLGTAYILQQKIIKERVKQVVLNLKVGQIPVTINYSGDTVEELWMQQKTPSFHQTFTPEVIADLLNLNISDIDSQYPIQEVSTGVPFIIVPLKTQAALKRSKVNTDKFFKLVETTLAKAVLVFCPETYHPENQLSVRVFVDYFGIPEDPATGSANGCLAGYLVQYSYFDAQTINLRVEQGYEIGRPSLLLLKAHQKDNEIEIFVGGKVILIAEGSFV